MVRIVNRTMKAKRKRWMKLTFRHLRLSIEARQTQPSWNLEARVQTTKQHKRSCTSNYLLFLRLRTTALRGFVNMVIA